MYKFEFLKDQGTGDNDNLPFQLIKRFNIKGSFMKTCWNVPKQILIPYGILIRWRETLIYCWLSPFKSIFFQTNPISDL